MKSRTKVLIANSVGKDDDGNHYILFPSRWSTCVGKTKSFNFYPYELGYLSSMLKQNKDLEVKMVDGNYEELTAEEYFEKYKKFMPDYLVVETSSVVYKYDLRFALKFKEKYGTKIIFCGQHPTAFPKEVLADGVDYVATGEYEPAVVKLVSGEKPKTIDGIYPNPVKELLDVHTLPFPEDDDISRMNYTRIGGCDYKEIEFFATRGCPMNCNFCVARQTYYGKPNFRVREVQNVIDEIKYLKNKYPEMDGIFFDEENHNSNKKFVMELCQAIIDNGLQDLKYDAMCGYWTFDEEMLTMMRKAGYYKIRIGIETASVKTALGMVKNVNVDRIIEVLKMAKKVGMRMYATFTFGSPDSNLTEDGKTLDLIEKLTKEGLLWDFQASVCTPQPGTPFYNLLKSRGNLLTDDWRKYNGNTAVYEYPDYKKRDIESNLPKAAWLYLKTRVRRRGVAETVMEIVRRDGWNSFGVKLIAFGKAYYRAMTA
ncbi:radical SAM protein [Candidatus Shapirobacteria bacterium]|nr:radical SAM protein [Candidatus Shapirobacteria bacterium]